MFQVRQTLKPGEPGTRKLADRFGDKLVCVRYRVDAARQRRFTTVELIVDEAPLTARRMRPRAPSVPDHNPMVGVRIYYREAGLREQVKSEGAIWRPRQKLWEMPLHTARRLGLGDRIVCGEPARAVTEAATVRYS
jgi:hypothetical protein